MQSELKFRKIIAASLSKDSSRVFYISTEWLLSAPVLMPAFQCVLTIVIFFSHDLKIGNVVVSLVMVNVMNNLGWIKETP